MATIDTDQLFEKAEELKSQRASVIEQQNAIREVLRNMDNAQLLSEEESAKLEEIYPTRTRNRSDEEGEGEDVADEGDDYDDEDEEPQA